MAAKLARRAALKSAPRIDSFLDFLLHHARVKSGAGYVPYHFAGREALRPIVERLDQILQSGECDCSLAICGGAQFGKTVLMLNLLAYLVAVRFRNVGYYLPDDDLVSGLVDGKLRPDVLDQIPWLARLIAVGRTLTPTGRATNRKGAFLCTDGTRTALAFMRGLGKIPTSFSMDVVVQDEKDDLPDEHARFLAGRMTASNLRLSLLIGTQRYHGAGQNLAFTEGTQHVGLLSCPGCEVRTNPETAWPGVCRLVVEGVPSCEWPRLTGEGHFSKEKVERKKEKVGEGDDVAFGASFDASVEGSRRRPCAGLVGCERVNSSLSGPGAPRPAVAGYLSDCDSQSSLGVRTTERVAFSPGLVGCEQVNSSLSGSGAPRPAVAGYLSDCDSQSSPGVRTTERVAYSPGQRYALCCPACGAELDRAHPQWHAEAPEREALRRWSYRISQLLMPAIELEQIVAAWQLAVRDADQMAVFCTDRLALPKSTTQTLTPALIEQARGDYLLEVKSEKEKGERAEGTDSSYFSLHTSSFARFGGLDMGDQCWFVARAVDTRPPYGVRLLWVESMAAERVRSRVPELFRALELTALCVDAGPLRDTARDLVFELNASAPPTWHEPSQKWRGVRAMAVEFTQREGMGLRHKFAQTQEGRAYPLLAAHRDETIERVVRELLPPGVGDPRLLERPDGTAEQIPTQRFFLPAKTESTREVLDLYERHLLAGSRQERDGKALRYLDRCENHFLLATAYAALAELIAVPVEEPPAPVVPMFGRVAPRVGERSLIG